MDADELASSFPDGIDLPSEIRALCDWVTANGYPISGYFELRCHDDETLRYWFNSDAALGRLTQFGAGADGSLYCLWRSPDGGIPVVHLGSEGDNIRALALSPTEFLRLLAIGYDELGSDDLDSPPDIRDPEETIQPAFRTWVAETFNVEIPAVGVEVSGPAQAAHGDFPAWVQGCCG